ncbi:MAG: DUF2235 domain-containing protein [Pseudomonadota bacterium]
MRLSKLLSRLRRRAAGPQIRPAPAPGRDHVVLIDGTLSSLEPGYETSVGLIWKMLEAEGHDCLYYEPGIAWRGWRNVTEVMAGVGINHQIRRAYAFLAKRYAPGDRIYLIGYSRGAYAVRALGGLIDRVGLLRADEVSEARVQVAYNHYRDDPTHPAARSFQARLCHDRVEIAAMGVFDTVQAVGIRWPVLWRLFPEVHAFRSHRLGRSVKRGFHAMALHETRRAYALDRWRTHGHRTDSVEQVWFRGSHGDLGGQLSGFHRARPLANVPLNWMLDRLASAGLALPPDWATRFPADAHGPSVGTWRGFGPVFLARRARPRGLDASEAVHPTAAHLPGATALPLWQEREREETAAE